MATHENNECAICLDKIDTTNRATLVCGHAIHVTCLVALAKHSDRCPLCRIPFYQIADSDSSSSEDSNVETADDRAEELERTEVYLLADSASDRRRTNWPRIPNTWPGYTTATTLSYHTHRRCHHRHLPAFSGDNRIENQWAWEVAQVMIVWFVFSKVATRANPGLAPAFRNGISKERIMDFMVLNDISIAGVNIGIQSLQNDGHVWEMANESHFSLTDAHY